jgi:hypothetical protein
MLLLITVLLLGALAAVIAFVFFDRDGSQVKIGELTAANAKLTEEKTQAVQKAEADVKRLTDENSKLTTHFGPYGTIADREGQVTQLREQIRAKTDQPVYAGFRMTAAERKALDSSAAWPPAALSSVSWRPRVEENLALQVAQLVALQDRVEKYIPSSGGESKTCTDPRKTWPNC